jgi:hypothetical protein
MIVTRLQAGRRVRFSEGQDFSLRHNVQTGSGVYSAFYPVYKSVRSFLEGKAAVA